VWRGVPRRATMVLGDAAGPVSQLTPEHRYRPGTSHGVSLRPRRTRVKRYLGRVPGSRPRTFLCFYVTPLTGYSGYSWSRRCASRSRTGGFLAGLSAIVGWTGFLPRQALDLQYDRLIWAMSPWLSPTAVTNSRQRRAIQPFASGKSASPRSQRSGAGARTSASW